MASKLSTRERLYKVKEVEKSPKLQMINYKEQMLLEKQLQLIDKSKQIVKTGIKADQKVTYKRFQHKLRQSQLSHARLNGDKAREKELLKRSSFIFNTNSGHSKEDDILKHLWRDSEEDDVRWARNVPRDPVGDNKDFEWFLDVPTPTASEDDFPPIPIEGFPTPALTTSEATQSFRRLSETAAVTVRPFTCEVPSQRPTSSVAPRCKTAWPTGFDHRRSELPYDMAAQNGGDHETPARTCWTNTFGINGELRSHNRFSNIPCEKMYVQQTTSMLRGKSYSAINPKPITAMKHLRPPVRSAPASKLRTPPLFGLEAAVREDDSPSLLDIHRERVKSAKYNERVQRFCDSIEHLRGGEGQRRDYYIWGHACNKKVYMA